MKIRIAVPLMITLVALVATGSAAQEESWVSRSDRNAQALLEVIARFNPEGAALLGIEGLDEEILQLPADRDDRQIKALEVAITDLGARFEGESDPRVRLDLEILIGAAELNIEQIRLNGEHLLPYLNLPRIVFQGVRSLLDEQSSAERRAAVEARLRRYAGGEEGFTPLTEQAEAMIRSRLARAELTGPYRGEIERDLTMSDRYISGMRDLLTEFEITGCDQYVDALADQIFKYNEFLRTEVLPRARRDFRLPPAIYTQLLEAMGVDMPIAELSSRAHVSFREIQNEMQAIAELIAERRNLESTDYRDVIRHLKRDQLIGEEILATYTARIEELEEIIEQHAVVTLPKREMRIRLASEAESAAIPSPFMLPPRLIGNTGEMGEFVLPYRGAETEDGDSPRVDDYTFDAASWTLAVHEGRPGHELQFSSMVENGVSLARSIFAFTSVNVEGWALYCEAEMKPYFPLDGQLISLQQRLLRAARAFLDPGLQNGTITEDEARWILGHDVVLSPTGVQKELDRYTFGDPAQATSYFCGYLRLMELRAEVERKVGDHFDRKAFHDFILSQGLLPPRLMRKAVLEGFVGGPDVPAFADPALAQESRALDSPGSAWTGSPEQKLWGLMTVWAETKYAFPWFKTRVALDWDATVRGFIPRVLAAEDLDTYYKVLSELVTLLQDSHTSVLPPWGHFTPGFDNPPVSIQVIEGKFLVVSVGDTDEIRDQRVYPGLEVLEIGEGRPVREYFNAEVLRYRTMGSPHANEAILPFFLLYGPAEESVSLRVRDLDGGTRQISLTRSSAQRDGSPFFPRFIANMMESSVTVRWLENGIFYVAIPTFENDQIRTDFVRQIDQTDLAAINGMILDLRGNMGGSSATSNGIVSCLIDKPAPSPTMTYPHYAAAERAWGRDTQWSTEHVEVAPRDGKRYLGTLVLLTDPITHSSAEDLVIELLSTGRTTVVGGKTAGGAGNAIRSELPGGGTLQVSTFRATYPDGREYVGTGITPDVELSPTQEDIASGRDSVLEKAIEILKSRQL